MQEQTQQKLISLSVTGLRRLKNLDVSFEGNDVTGVFGVNGCGKTTLLYVLLCLYNQKNTAFQFNFGTFFKKCSSNEFNTTKITATVSYRIGKVVSDHVVTYKKSVESDRWTPKTSRRPERKVYFFGVSSRTPDKTLCFNESNSECLESMTGDIQRPIEVYVEDKLAKTMVSQVAKELGISKRVVVKQYGSCANAFVASCGIHMLNIPLEHKLFVLDGDLYRTEDDRMSQLMKFYSGTEHNKEAKRKEVLQHISQFNLPEGSQPEQYVHDILVKNIGDKKSEIVELAENIIAPDNPHEYIDKIIDGLGDDENVGLYRIIDEFATHPEWYEYTEPIRQWLINEKKALAL